MQRLKYCNILFFLVFVRHLPPRVFSKLIFHFALTEKWPGGGFPVSPPENETGGSSDPTRGRDPRSRNPVAGDPLILATPHPGNGTPLILATPHFF